MSDIFTPKIVSNAPTQVAPSQNTSVAQQPQPQEQPQEQQQPQSKEPYVIAEKDGLKLWSDQRISGLTEPTKMVRSVDPLGRITRTSVAYEPERVGREELSSLGRSASSYDIAYKMLTEGLTQQEAQQQAFSAREAEKLATGVKPETFEKSTASKIAEMRESFTDMYNRYGTTIPEGAREQLAQAQQQRTLQSSPKDFELTSRTPTKLTYKYTGEDAYTRPQPAIGLSLEEQNKLIAQGRQADIQAIYSQYNYQVPLKAIEEKYEQLRANAPGYEKDVITKLPTLMATGKAFIPALGGDVYLSVPEQSVDQLTPQPSSYSDFDIVEVTTSKGTERMTKAMFEKIKGTYDWETPQQSKAEYPKSQKQLFTEAFASGELQTKIPSVASGLDLRNIQIIERSTQQPLKIEYKEQIVEAVKPQAQITYEQTSKQMFKAFELPVIKEAFGGLDAASQFVSSGGERVATQQEQAYPGLLGQASGTNVRVITGVTSGVFQFPKWALKTTGEAVNIATQAVGSKLLYEASKDITIRTFAPDISKGLKAGSVKLAEQTKEGVISKGSDIAMLGLSLFGGAIIGGASKTVKAVPMAGEKVITSLGGKGLLETGAYVISKIPAPARDVAGKAIKISVSTVEPALTGVAVYTTLENPREAGKFFAPTVAGAGAKFLFAKPVAEIVGSKTVVLMERQTTTPSGLISEQVTFAKGGMTPKGAQFTFESPVVAKPAPTPTFQTQPLALTSKPDAGGSFVRRIETTGRDYKLFSQTEGYPGVVNAQPSQFPPALTGQVPAIKTSINWGKGTGRPISASVAESNVAQEVLVTGKGRGELIAVEGQSRFEKATEGFRNLLNRNTDTRVASLGTTPTVRSTPAGTFSFDFRTQVYDKPRLEFTPTKQLQGVEFKTDIEGYANLFTKGQPAKSVPFKQTQYSQTGVKQVGEISATVSRESGAIDVYRPAKVQAPGRTDVALFEAQPKKFAQGPSEIPILKTYTEGTLGGKKIASYGESVDLLQMQTPIGKSTLSTGSLYSQTPQGKFVYSSQMDTAVIDVRGKPIRSFEEWGRIMERGEPISVRTQPTANANVYRQEYPNPYNRLEAGQVKFEPYNAPLALPAKATVPVVPPGAIGEGNVWFRTVAKTFKPAPTFSGLTAPPQTVGIGGVSVKTSGGLFQIQKTITQAKTSAQVKEGTAVKVKTTTPPEPQLTKQFESTTRTQTAQAGEPQLNVRVQPPKLKFAESYRSAVAPPQQKTEYKTGQKPASGQSVPKPQGSRQTNRAILVTKRATAQRQATIQRQATVQRQPTVQRQATARRLATGTPTPSIFDPPPPPRKKEPPFYPGGDKPSPLMAKKAQMRSRSFNLKNPQVTGSRSIYADLISVMGSQLKYGKATSASLVKRPGVWKYANNAIGFVPTAEQLNAMRRKR